MLPVRLRVVSGSGVPFPFSGLVDNGLIGPDLFVVIIGLVDGLQFSKAIIGIFISRNRCLSILAMLNLGQKKYYSGIVVHVFNMAKKKLGENTYNLRSNRRPISSFSKFLKLEKMFELINFLIKIQLTGY